MSRFIDWTAWNWDLPTAIFVIWVVGGFIAFEYLTSGATPIEGWEGNMVTDHLRPIFHAAPVTWWLGLGLWLWIGPHILWPAAENAIRRAVGS